MPRIQNIHQPAELKNYAINGALDFWQEKVGTTSTVNTASSVDAYSADMFSYQSGGPTTKNYSLQRSTTVPTAAQAGFNAAYSILFTMITAIPSFNTADFVNPCNYRMEGFDYAKLHGGVVGIGFWIQASVAGTYSVSIRNAGANRSYVTTVTVNNPNTPEYKFFSFQTDSSGTWAFDNTIGMNIQIGSYAGATYQTASLNTWQAGNFVTASTATNYMATAGATLRVSLLSIVQGAIGFGAIGFQRAGKTIQQERALCERYYEKSYDINDTPGAGNATGAIEAIAYDTASRIIEKLSSWSTPKRVSPTMTMYSITGSSGVIRNGSLSSDIGVAGVSVTHRGMYLLNTNGTSAGSIMRYHYVADARL